MRLLAPEWLILVPTLLFAAWRWQSLRMRRPLRVFLISLIVLLLVQPELRTDEEGLDVWVLIDRSASAAQYVAGGIREWEQLIQRGKGREDVLHWVDFADGPQVRGEGDAAVFSGSPGRTNLASALRHVLAQLRPARSSRLLVFTDGYSTEPLADLGRELAGREVPLDYRLIVRPRQTDYRVENLLVPARVDFGEPYIVELEVGGEPDGEVSYRLERDGALIAEDKLNLREGRALARFSDRVRTPGAYRYSVEISAPGDAYAGNNRGQAWVEMAGKPRLLYITSYAADPLAAELQRQGIDVEIAAEPSTLTVGKLAAARAIVINNVAAHHIPQDFLKALDFFVRVQGGGLIMIGGKNSFGSGGFFGSAVEDLLPVSMELRTEHKLTSVSMAIVLDRSGSMSMGVAGSGDLSKMDLANEGAIQAIQLLGSKDEVCVFAVDSEPHVVVPRVMIGDVRSSIIDATRGINSMGGGIFIYNGLDLAWRTLKDSSIRQKHIILFADAADSEEPGAYKTILQEMREADATVSVIGLGTAQDTDAGLLMDIAARGGGRLFFSQDPSAIPALFTQDASAVARSAFIDKTGEVSPTGAWKEISAVPLSWVSAVDGYNLSYLKEGAGCAAFAKDEYESQLVAFWQRGAGRTAAVSFPLAGDYSAQARSWAEYGRFGQSLARWIMGGGLPPGLGLRFSAAGTTLIIDLLYAPEWEDQFGAAAPRLIYAEGLNGEPKEAEWERMRPGAYRASLPLLPDAVLRGAVTAGQHVLPFGPVTTVVDPEWSFNRQRLDELLQTSALSRGTERLDLTSIWKSPRRSGWTSLKPYLLVVFVIVFLVEALVARLGVGLALPGIKVNLIALLAPIRIRLPHLRLAQLRERRSSPVPKQEAGPPTPEPSPKGSERRERFLKAKNKE